MRKKSGQQTERTVHPGVVAERSQRKLRVLAGVEHVRAEMALDAAQQATNSALLEASIAGASRVLFSISGGPDLTLTEVDEAARTVEACADENANIIYGQIIDEGMGDAVRITVIATGFKMGASQQSSMDFSRKDLFASTSSPEPAPAPQPSTYSTLTSTPGRFADEDYIPDFLKRQR